MFLDDDDLIEPTFFECAYWTLETNSEAAWAYSDSIGFGTREYTWNKYFDSEKLKEENELIKKYKKQLKINKKALEDELEEKITHTYIYSIYLNKKIELD